MRRPLSRKRLLWYAGAAWLLICSIGEIISVNYPREFVTDYDSHPTEAVVQLRASTIPYIRLIATHPSFVAYDPETERWHRWEIWQTADADGRSWGHLHQDLLSPDADTGAGPAYTEFEWRGKQARDLLAVLKAPESYPDRDTYRYWPGPNSNTYPAWVLREAGVRADLSPQAIGKDYRGLIGDGVTTTGTGVQLETPILGLKLGLMDGVEIHWLCLTFGIDIWPPPPARRRSAASASRSDRRHRLPRPQGAPAFARATSRFLLSFEGLQL